MTEIIPATSSNLEQLSETDKNLVNETLNGIIEIMDETTKNIHLEVGNYIISKIFDDNHQLAWTINEPDSKEPKSILFKHLEEEIKKRNGEIRIPKKTWLYNAVKVALDVKLLEDNQEYLEKYTKLSFSHQIEISTVKSLDEKIDLIKTIIEKGSSVRDIRKEKGSLGNKPGLLTYIKDPTKILNFDDIVLVGGKKRDTAIELINDEITAISNDIEIKKESVSKLNQLKIRLQTHIPTRGRKKKQ